MTLLPRVDGAEERMDAPDVDHRHLDAALRHIAGVNRWLGGTRALLHHLPGLLPPVVVAGDEDAEGGQQPEDDESEDAPGDPPATGVAGRERVDRAVAERV